MEIFNLNEQEQSSTPASPRAVRLTFGYESNDVRLVTRQSVKMVVPPTDALSGYEGQQGFWVEVRNEGNETLYRRVMHDPLRQDVEIFSPDPRESVARTPLEKPSGIFVVLIPDLDEADHVALLSSAAPSAPRVAPEGAALDPMGPATELARFSLRPDDEADDS